MSEHSMTLTQNIVRPSANNPDCLIASRLSQPTASRAGAHLPFLGH